MAIQKLRSKINCINMSPAPTKSATKPISHTEKMLSLHSLLRFSILSHFIVSHSTKKSITKFAGNTKIQPLGYIYNNHQIGNDKLYSRKFLLFTQSPPFCFNFFVCYILKAKAQIQQSQKRGLGAVSSLGITFCETALGA